MSTRRGDCTDRRARGDEHFVTGDVLFSLVGYILVYALFVSFGFYYIYKLLRDGPAGEAVAISGATPNRPLAFADDAASATGMELHRTASAFQSMNSRILGRRHLCRCTL